MSGSDDFLARWARRKRKVARQEKSEKPAAEARDQEALAAQSESERDARGDETTAKTPRAKDEKQDEPAFDLSKLPSLDSITATSDIRPFLAAGVPAALRNAALRRMWSADPGIRDFIEVAENQWDFNAPGIPGFDPSPPTGDIRRMLADIFGEKLPEDESQAAVEAQADESSEKQEQQRAETRIEDDSPASHRNVKDASEPVDAAGTNDDESPDAVPQNNTEQKSLLVAEQREKNFATHQNDAAQENETRPFRRSHGSAVPR